MSSKEQRRFTRSPVQLEGDVFTEGGNPIHGELRDVGLSGVFVCCDQRYKVGTACTVVLYIGGRKSGTRIEASGKVTRVHDDGLALGFTDIPSESYAQLRDLVLNNSPDANRTEEEFRNLRGFPGDESGEESPEELPEEYPDSQPDDLAP